MDAAQVLQAVLSLIPSGTGAATATATHLQTAATDAPSRGSVASPPAAPLSLPELLMALLSAHAVQFLLLGVFLATCRRFLVITWESAWERLWLTATFDWDDDTADWVLHWLSRRKVFNTARTIEVSALCYGLRTSTIDDLGYTDDGDEVCFVPSLSKTYSVWYRGRYMTVRREMRDKGSYIRPGQYLELRVLCRDPRLLRDILVEARREYQQASQNAINVHVAESSDRWKHVATQEKRPISSVILDPGVLELVLEDARDFLQSRKWYADRGIPFRRGYLLYGAPGTGKTSMIHSIAGELGLSIYILSLTVMGLDDNSLKSLIAHLPKTCILLIEDIDAAFHRGVKRDLPDPEDQARTGAGQSKEGGEKPQDALYNGVTLSGLLNALDGIAAQEGRILVATTNNYSALDPALLRPGRLDLHIEFHLASRHQARQLFERFYTSDDVPSSGESEVGEKDDSDHNTSDSDVGVPPYPNQAATDGSSALFAASRSSSSLPEAVRTVYVGMTRGAASFPRLSAEEVSALAERFAATIPPRTFSMASLQGYLMAYKIRPLNAVLDAPAWVERRLQEKEKTAHSTERSKDDHRSEA
ncbi:P-loop containing nucleoside triphosphate hydrolase protein [Trametes punicea]|nr:P-loop containing nucleoside triphosphate hydrolase protein [Trametes punicea]